MDIVLQNTENTVSSVVTFLRNLGISTLIMLGFLIAARLLRGVVRRFSEKRRLPPDITNLLLQISEVSLLLFGLVTALGTMGINVGALIAGLGLIGFALGYALKDLVSNFLSGLLILLYTPFVRGDKINVSNSEGTVIEINLRYTILDGGEKKILIPNQSIFSNVVIVEKKNPQILVEKEKA